MMTRADKMQVYSLGATLTALGIGFVCRQTADRGDGMNAIVAVVATIGMAPVLLALHEKCKNGGRG
jgi:hypothetical protein